MNMNTWVFKLKDGQWDAAVPELLAGWSKAPAAVEIKRLGVWLASCWPDSLAALGAALTLPDTTPAAADMALQCLRTLESRGAIQPDQALALAPPLIELLAANHPADVEAAGCLGLLRRHVPGLLAYLANLAPETAETAAFAPLKERLACSGRALPFIGSPDGRRLLDELVAGRVATSDLARAEAGVWRFMESADWPALPPWALAPYAAGFQAALQASPLGEPARLVSLGRACRSLALILRDHAEPAATAESAWTAAHLHDAAVALLILTRPAPAT